MIDRSRKKIGYKEFVAAEALLTAAAIMIGAYSQGVLTGRHTDSVQAGGLRVEAAETGVTKGTDSEISAETAAEAEPADNDGSSSAAYAKIQGDGEAATETVLSFTDSKYWGKEMILINPWHLLPEDYEADLEHVVLFQSGWSDVHRPAEHRRHRLLLQILRCDEDGLAGDRGQVVLLQQLGRDA
jgi:hypothetical protein